MATLYDINHKSPIRNAVYRGAGLGGISYLGAQRALEEYGLFNGIRNYAGSSAGALFSGFAACDVKSEDCIKLILDTNFANLLDDESGNLIGKGIELWKQKGLYRGVAMNNWYGDALEKLVGDRNITYGDVLQKYGKNNITVISNVTIPRIEHFSSIDTPNVKLQLGGRITSSIPGMFSPVTINGQNYIDGSYLAPYPFFVFKNDLMGTLGWKVVNSANTDNGPGLTAYIKQLLFGPSVELERWQHIPGSEDRTIEIDVEGMDVLDFNISQYNKEKLIKLGYDSTKQKIRMSI